MNDRICLQFSFNKWNYRLQSLMLINLITLLFYDYFCLIFLKTFFLTQLLEKCVHVVNAHSITISGNVSIQVQLRFYWLSMSTHKYTIRDLSCAVIYNVIKQSQYGFEGVKYIEYRNTRFMYLLMGTFN